jgi:hypothetical protein
LYLRGGDVQIVDSDEDFRTGFCSVAGDVGSEDGGGGVGKGRVEIEGDWDGVVF